MSVIVSSGPVEMRTPSLFGKTVSEARDAVSNLHGSVGLDVAGHQQNASPSNANAIILYTMTTTLLFSTKSTPYSSNPPRKLYIFRHNSNPLRMDSTEICVFEEMNKKCFCGFL